MKKATILAAAAAMVAGQVSAAGSHGHRHAHRALFEKKEVDNGDGVCVPTCTTIYSTITGEPTLVQPAPVTTSTSAPPPPVTTSSGPILVPTPIAQTCPTPGTYTFPATTVVVTETTTVCGASSTTLPSGTHTIGGVTTVVETATTVVCPYATTETQPNGVVTSVIKTTTYVCPSAGTYTIAPITTTVPSVTTVIVPVVTTYCPGTYTAPAVVTTVTETDIVVYCPFTSSEAPAPTSAPVAATSAAPAPAQSSASSSPSTSLGSSSGKLWAMTYTPYDASGHCKTASAVLSDVAEIAKAGFTTLRVYSTDCGTLPNVGAAARQYGLRLIVGIFIGEVGCDNASPDVADQISALKAWKQWDLVDLCVVANEALANGFCTVSQLTDLITHVKSELVSVGYTGPFTTTDVVASWLDLEVQTICEVIDVVGTNAHAYFNAQTLPEAAGVFVASQLALVERVCNKPGYVLETGWPSAGNCNGVACPSVDNQRVAIEAIKEELGNKVTFFSFHDDGWKEAGQCNCEKHWGCSSVFNISIDINL